jgi:hypothetical protein
LQRYRKVIAELTCLKNVIEQMAVVLKARGLNRQTLRQCKALLKECKKGRLLCFKEKVLQQWKRYQGRLRKGETLLCCSDVVESCFGRLKLQVESGGNQALTESVLTMCGFGTDITREAVTEALNRVHMQELSQWKEQNTIPSLQQKRREFFSKN